MIKKLFLFLIFGIFLISLVSAYPCGKDNSCDCTDGSCSPSSGYNVCYWAKTVCGSATAYAEVQASNIQGVYKSGYYIGKTWIKFKFSGDRYYYAKNIGSWNNVNCNENGCSAPNSLQLGFNEGTYKLTDITGIRQYTDCPVFIVWDRDDNEGYWAWAYRGYGWGEYSGNCFDIKSVECYDDSDCGSGKICDKTGDWTTWSCEEQAACPNLPWNYNPAYPITVKDCRVTQYVEKLSHCPGSGFYMYIHNQPELSTMIMSESTYQSLVPQECYAQPECYTDVDCPPLQVLNRFCSGKDLMQQEKYPYCSGGKCMDAIRTIKLETCQYQCGQIGGNYQCIVQSCNQGEKKCSGNDLLECQNNQFVKLKTCEFGCENGQCKEEQMPSPSHPNYLIYVLIGGLIIFTFGLIWLLGRTKGRKKKKVS